MTDAGIHDEDILVVDRSVEPENGSIVVAALDGELTVKRYEMRSGYPYLMPEAEEYDPIPIQDGQELVVWGVKGRSKLGKARRYAGGRHCHLKIASLAHVLS